MNNSVAVVSSERTDTGVRGLATRAACMGAGTFDVLCARCPYLHEIVLREPHIVSTL